MPEKKVNCKRFSNEQMASFWPQIFAAKKTNTNTLMCTFF